LSQTKKTAPIEDRLKENSYEIRTIGDVLVCVKYSFNLDSLIKFLLIIFNCLILLFP
jgi:hypothetical protein